MNSVQKRKNTSSDIPSIKDLEKLLYGGRRFGNHVDEVWPNLFIGDMSVANDRYSLWKLGITHVLNAAHGRMHCQGSHDFYGATVDYYGVPADDSPSFDLSRYFSPSAEYIQSALETPGGRIIVHCAVGVSRSASLVLAYLMIHHHYSLLDAINKVVKARGCVRPDTMLRGLSCLTSPEMAEGRYETPPASELQRLMWTKKGTSGHLDEVQPRIYIGDMYAAKDKRTLQARHITHVLNAAHGKFNVKTGASFYRDTNITYHGVEAFDMSTFNMSPFFYPAANFIKGALSSPTGKAFVHCAMGLSRSSTLVLAYLMIHRKMTLVDAIKAVSANRNICPNEGFLEQLRELDRNLSCRLK